MHDDATPWKFDPDASYDLYGLTEDGDHHLHPLYRIIERHFYNTADRLPDGTYRGIAGCVVLRNAPEHPVMAGETTQFGIIKDGLFIRGDRECFVLVKVPGL